MAKKGAEEIEILVRARYPLIGLETHEESRAEGILRQIATGRDKKLYCWSITRGLHEQGTSLQSKKGTDQATRDPLSALDQIIQMVEPALFLLKDFHPFLADPAIVRRLREVAQHLKSSYKTVILVSPRLKIPLELEKEMTVVDFPLPDLQELGGLLDRTIREINEKTELRIDPGQVPREQILKAALGLTLAEAENVFAKSLIRGGRLTANDIPVILEEKEQIIRKSGILEYYPAAENFHDIGGLEILKDWLGKRRLAFTEKARAYGLPFPKGVLLLGVQGCGKSLCAKAVSVLWSLPLLRFDVGKVFSSLIGSSEENIRRAIQAAESVAPAILWIDEIEKAFSGTLSSGMSDGGTTARVFGNFLTWLQEKTSPVFVIAPANDISALPPELLRKGRLDEIFFVDLPTRVEREDILRIHLRKRGRDLDAMDLQALAAQTRGFSGAELEQGIISALFDAFEHDQPLEAEMIGRALGETVPLSTTMREEIDALRAWAAGRARKASLEEPEEAVPVEARKYEL